VAATATRARKSFKPDEAAIRQSELLAAPSDEAWLNPGKRGANLPVSEFLTYALGRLTGMIRRSFMPAYVEPFGLTIPEWRVMAAIAGASLSFNEICRAITMDRAQVSRTLASLVAKGIVAQLTAARADRRGRGHGLTQTKLILTPEGARTYKRILPIAQRHQMILLSVLDAEERSVVRRALRKMMAAAEEFEAKGPDKASIASAQRKPSQPRAKRSGRDGASKIAGTRRQPERVIDSHRLVDR
jgi:DNA-binding MarR family transcriptional regulator